MVGIFRRATIRHANVNREHWNCSMSDEMAQPVGFTEGLFNSLRVGNKVSFHFGWRYCEKFEKKANYQFTVPRPVRRQPKDGSTEAVLTDMVMVMVTVKMVDGLKLCC